MTVGVHTSRWCCDVVDGAARGRPTNASTPFTSGFRARQSVPDCIIRANSYGSPTFTRPILRAHSATVLMLLDEEIGRHSVFDSLSALIINRAKVGKATAVRTAAKSSARLQRAPSEDVHEGVEATCKRYVPNSRRCRCHMFCQY